MENNHLNIPLILQIGQCKSMAAQSQKQTIFQYLQEYTATNSMISAATGIPRRNICRYKRELETAGNLQEVVKTHCRRTGFKAWYLTTNVEKVSAQSTQPNKSGHGT
jgi:hypothetical protein